ncbi:dienelactone hydrolase family protein [Isobaculum melis]|uniref:Peptidase S9 prolyl oligopeptidase catalytic domain-containing protein n=1 Tax=Isobaculum melis TaxID=142588 RepID=A0A1H9R4K7_9LACT|nr:dienelactone hydrolase family protein [Isobaculum melis]SER67781.1 hypothetical protein SAMN04488559_10360 [Isobaculum melis]
MISIQHEVVSGIPVLNVAPADKMNEKLPTVIFYHGWTNYKESVLVNGYELAKRGFRAILPEAYLHGERKESELVEEKYMEFWEVVLANIKELPLLHQHYLEKGLLDAERFGVTGLSMGGITTCAMLTQFDFIKAAVCLMGSPAPMEFSKWLLQSSWATGTKIPADTVEQIGQLAPIDLSVQPEKINGRPVHFWHGTADELVPYKPTKDFYEHIKNEPYAKNVSFTTSKGVGHRVPYLTSVEMAEFFEKVL